MKALVLFSVFALATSAFADIPRPPVSNAVEVSVVGLDALELYETLDVQVRQGSALRTSSSTYKIFRTESGETQIVCEKTVSRVGVLKATASCKLSKSTDGHPLPVFRIRVRMG